MMKHASSHIGMSIERSYDVKKFYVNQNGVTNRMMADFSSDSFPTASSPALFHLFNNVSIGPFYDRIK